ncbi:hypothetical protein LINPERHAP1_LOCUS32975, partial [Linum perenne]
FPLLRSLPPSLPHSLRSLPSFLFQLHSPLLRFQFNGSAASTSSPPHLCSESLTETELRTPTSPVVLSWPLHPSVSTTLVSTIVSTSVGNRLEDDVVQPLQLICWN